MAQYGKQAQKVAEMCRGHHSPGQVVEGFNLNSWANEHKLQLTVQQLVVSYRDVDAAIEILKKSEYRCNLTLDFDELIHVVVQHATPAQALKALRQVHLAPAHYLQPIILIKGTHEQIEALKAWQLSPNKLESKGVL